MTIKRIIRALAYAVVVVAVLAAMTFGIVETPWFKGWLRGYIIQEAKQYVNGGVTIGRLGGNLFSSVELEGVRIVAPDGTEALSVRRVGLNYSVLELVSSGMALDSMRFDEPVVHVSREGDAWSVSRLIKKQEQEADRQGPGRPFSVREIGISNGSLVVDGPQPSSAVVIPRRVEHLDARFAFKYEPIHYTLDIAHMSFRAAEPELALNSLSGTVAVRDDAVYLEKVAIRTAETSVGVEGAVQHYLTAPDAKLVVSSDTFSLPELSGVVPALAGIDLKPKFDVELAGPMDAFHVGLHTESTAGRLAGTMILDVTGPSMSAKGELSAEHLNVAPIAKRSDLTTDVDGNIRLDAHAENIADLGTLRGTAHVDLPRVVAAGYSANSVVADVTLDGHRGRFQGRAHAYGATTTMKGSLRLSEKGTLLGYEARGRATHVDASRLPRVATLPAAKSNVNADFNVTGAGNSVRAHAAFLPSTVAGAQIAEGSTVDVELGGREPRYRGDLSIAHLNPRAAGRAFGVRAVDDPKYDADVNVRAHFDGAGTQASTMEATFDGELSDSKVAGGDVSHLTFNGRVGQNSAQLTLEGQVANMDPAVAGAPSSASGRVGGSFSLDASLKNLSEGVTADNIDASLKATVEPSQVGTVAINSAVIDTTYKDSTADIKELRVEGPDVHANAMGTVSLSEGGQSNLQFDAAASDLKLVAQTLGQPVTGIGKISGTVQGNRSKLQVSGTLTANDLTYGDNGDTRALTVAANYSATVCDLKIEAVNTTTEATFVHAAGQDIGQLNAKIDYADQKVSFDVTAKQPERSVTAGGSLVLEPEQQEVRLEHLAVSARGKQWQNGPGKVAEIEYGNGDVAVRNLEVVSAGQTLSVDGAFGRSGDALAIKATDVDLADVDAMLLREPQFSGRLNLSGTLTGTREAPGLKGEFAVDQGGFRQFKYETLKGSVDYTPSGATVDVRLQQNPDVWIAANGFVPSDAITSAPSPANAKHDFDLRVESSALDLGLVQGFTTAVTNVSGTMQANLKVTGPARNPHPEGDITLSGGALTVPATGVAYTGLDGHLELRDDRLEITDLGFRDSENHQATLSGEIAVSAQSVGDVSVALKAHDLVVLNNKMGQLKVNSDLRFTGDLTKPKLEGELAISTGRIELDPVLATTANSPYDVKQTEYEVTPGSVNTGAATPAAGSDVQPSTATSVVTAQPASTPSTGSGQTVSPSLFDALQLDVHFTVPDDLVVRSNDLKAPGAALGAGSANITFGGDLQATKDPKQPIRLTGSVNTVRGTYDFRGRRFDILRDGTIRFAGLDTLDPTLDIKAQRVIEAVEATVNVRGTLMRPVIVLSSVPPLEQAEILSLIVFNQPVNQLGEGQQVSLAQQATAMATGVVANQLAGSIGRALNLDTFEIKTGSGSGSAVQVTAGQQIGDRAFVKIEQGVGDQTQTNFIFEYLFLPWLRLQSNVIAGSSIQQSLFQRVRGSGADLIVLLPIAEKK